MFGQLTDIYGHDFELDQSKFSQYKTLDSFLDAIDVRRSEVPVRRKAEASLDSVIGNYILFHDEFKLSDSEIAKNPYILFTEKENAKLVQGLISSRLSLTASKAIKKLPNIYRYISSDLNIHLDDLESNFEMSESQIKNNLSLITYDITTLQDKADAYTFEGIDYTNNYSLLTKVVENVLTSRDLIIGRGVAKPEKGNWYERVIGIPVDYLEPKIEYCDSRDMDWVKKPEVLLLGLGTDKNPGSLVKKVNLIDYALNGKDLPDNLNYKENPALLYKCTYSDLKKRVRGHYPKAKFPKGV